MTHDSPNSTYTLRNLADVPLDDYHQDLLDGAQANMGGPAIWQQRKRVESFDLVALDQLAARMQLEHLDLREALRAAVRVRAPVATRKHADAPVEIQEEALLGLTIRETALYMPQPGYAFIEMLQPRHCWHANISRDSLSRDGIAALCLGESLVAGIRATDLLVMAFGALQMTTVMVDEMDSAGVMNPEAARWWQLNMDRVPLSNEPFLS